MGMALIGVPVVIYQWDNDTAPLGLDWPGRMYAGMCIASGGIGGLMMVPTRDADDDDNNNHRHRGRLGYRWVGGMLSGALTASVAYWASWRIGLEQEDVVDLPLILFCAVPGLILYSLVQQCSDRTFPNNPRRYNYHWLPDNNIHSGDGGSGGMNNNDSPRRSILRESRFATANNPRRTPLTESRFTVSSPRR